MEITFPTTTEVFTARQEAGAGRKLNDFEKELMRRSVEVLNDCYEGGRTGKRIPFPESEEDARLFWTKTAYEQGKEAARHD